jgi:hypothetical protein
MPPSMPTERNGKIDVGLTSGEGGQIMQVFPTSSDRRIPWWHVIWTTDTTDGTMLTRALALRGFSG